jgi:L-ascorbate metabolism protein UlaG (beta-lactamase superfamily)
VTDDSGRPIYLGEPAGVIIQVQDKVIFHAGDTALFSDLKLIGEDVPIDLAFLPIGEHFVMGPKEFARLAAGKGAKVSILQPGESLEV